MEARKEAFHEERILDGLLEDLRAGQRRDQ